MAANLNYITSVTAVNRTGARRQLMIDYLFFTETLRPERNQLAVSRTTNRIFRNTDIGEESAADKFTVTSLSRDEDT